MMQFSGIPRAMAMKKTPTVIAFTGRSGSGKTTLIEKLVARFSSRGLRVGVIKHMRHDFDIDHPGKDTHRYRGSGAAVSSITNGKSLAIIADGTGGISPLDAAPALFSKCDLVIIEGQKEGAYPKIEVIGASAEPPLYLSGVEGIVALASDLPRETDLPVFRRDDIEPLAMFIARLAKLTP
jgi:molybdopterin-guanine dinucleotide biosynthesis protein B